MLNQVGCLAVGLLQGIMTLSARRAVSVGKTGTGACRWRPQQLFGVSCNVICVCCDFAYSTCLCMDLDFYCKLGIPHAMQSLGGSGTADRHHTYLKHGYPHLCQDQARPRFGGWLFLQLHETSPVFLLPVPLVEGQRKAGQQRNILSWARSR